MLIAFLLNLSLDLRRFATHGRSQPNCYVGIFPGSTIINDCYYEKKFDTTVL